jgi:sulfur carrier protein
MKVVLRNPTREVEVDDAGTVAEVLRSLEIVPESVLVIRDGELLLKTDRLGADDLIELRPVISGG